VLIIFALFFYSCVPQIVVEVIYIYSYNATTKDKHASGLISPQGLGAGVSG